LIALIEWIKRLIVMIIAWLSGPGQGLTIPWNIAADPALPPGWLRVPIEIAPDPPQLDRVPWLKIPLEVATDAY
jgi:hypothetical protein